MTARRPDEARKMPCIGPDSCGKRVAVYGRWQRLCTAPDCMAWRWVDPAEIQLDSRFFAAPGTDPATIRKGERLVTETSGRWEDCWFAPNLERRGFCGLAGEPEAEEPAA